ncbi:hypothetical protein [Clostridium fungisolvens]|uniref:Uncharacterized protein n=1 Tax=Clostridium fungisolvens TaxID=1604897 RepID=A0A6V8SD13_9CLOT|nr:hypothetical protein [Clostridium fungisolvens]GFP75134.1 hypothetical protein bsdtw1_01205 [Clostridium fungisolvens]
MKGRVIKWVSLSIFFILILIVSIRMGMTYYLNTNTTLIRYEKGKKADDISYGENYSIMANLDVINKGKKIGYVAGEGNKNIYDIYEIKGLDSSEWVAVNDSDEPGGRGTWVCKKDSVKLPKISDYGVNEIEILQQDGYYTIKTIKNSEDINKIIDVITSSGDETKIAGPFDGRSYLLYFKSPQFKGIAYRGYLTITKNGKYYARLAGYNYIEVTNEFKKYI